MCTTCGFDTFICHNMLATIGICLMFFSGLDWGDGFGEDHRGETSGAHAINVNFHSDVEITWLR